MQIQVITLPYDSGQRGKRMGAGPEYFVEHGLIEHLQRWGHELHVEQIEAESTFAVEIGTSFELYRLLAGRVEQARSSQRFPLVLSGNCGSALGTVAGCAPRELGVVWFDAHGDFNTPETSESGFLDGMGLATLTGRCWQAIAARIPGFHSISDGAVVHIGGRDFGEQEETLFRRSHIRRIHPESLRGDTPRSVLRPALLKLQAERPSIYLHLDLDVLDANEAVANQYATSGGLRVAQVRDIIATIGDYVAIEACGVASYDPRCDRDDATLHAGFQLIDQVMASVETAR